MKGVSVNRACAIGAAFLGSISLIAMTAAFLLTGNPTVVWLGLLFIVLVFACTGLFVVFLRHKLVLFSDTLCQTIDDMLDGTSPLPQVYEEENLFYKINHRLLRLEEKPYSLGDKHFATLEESIADLKDPNKDCHYTLDAMLADMDGFVDRFHRDFEWYSMPVCTDLYPQMSQVQYEFIQRRFHAITATIENLLQMIGKEIKNVSS